MEIKRIVVGALETNCYVVFTDKKDAFIIDPGDEAASIKKVIKNNSLEVNFIINTHSHIDHIKADSELGFPVYIHKEDSQALMYQEKNSSTYVLGSFTPCNPARLLLDNDVIDFDNLKLQVIHTPGHTPGGICIKMDNVVFTGDTLFRDGIGRTDLPDGSYDQIISSIKNRLLCLDDSTIVYPGHGEKSTIGRERRNF